MVFFSLEADDQAPFLLARGQELGERCVSLKAMASATLDPQTGVEVSVPGRVSALWSPCSGPRCICVPWLWLHLSEPQFPLLWNGAQLAVRMADDEEGGRPVTPREWAATAVAAAATALSI